MPIADPERRRQVQAEWARNKRRAARHVEPTSTTTTTVATVEPDEVEPGTLSSSTPTPPDSADTQLAEHIDRTLRATRAADDQRRRHHEQMERSRASTPRPIPEIDDLTEGPLPGRPHPAADSLRPASVPRR